jgi:hypothetical protein
MLCGGRTFSPAAEFFGWFSRKFLKLVGNSDYKVENLNKDEIKKKYYEITAWLYVMLYVCNRQAKKIFS